MKFFLHFYQCSDCKYWHWFLLLYKWWETKKNMLTFYRTKIWSFEWLFTLFSQIWWLKLEMNRRSRYLFPFPLFLIILNHTSQIFQSSSSHFLLFTPRHAKSQLKKIQPKKSRRARSVEGSAFLSKLRLNQFKTKER